MSKRKCSLASFFVFAITIFVSPLFAQNVVTGDVAGTVTDPTGAVVPNAKVELKNSETGFDNVVVTGNNGEFRFSLLKPGRYNLNISSSAFSAATRNVSVNLGQVTNASTTLSVGASSTTVEVSGEAPVLQTENANLTTTYDTRVVQELPNPGGDITYYAQTAPGIAMNTSGSGYGNFSAFGLPSTSNLFTMNGNDENDPFLNLNNSGSSNLLLGKNEVQEVAVVTNGYTGQYGRQAGADVNYTTKSGTNQFHGDLTYDWNGSALNANEWFNKAAGNPRPFANSNQWGADFGGPIVKNKTFFYVDTEGLRYILPTTQGVFFPTPAFSSAMLANIGAVAPAQLPFYQQMMTLYRNAPGYATALPSSAANGGCGDLTTVGFGSANPCLETLTSNGKNLNEEWLLTTRIDQNIGPHDNLFGRFKTDHGQQPTSTDLINNSLFGTHSNQPEFEGQLNETHTFGSNMVNNLIASGSWYSAVFDRNSGEPTALAALPYSTVSFTGTGSNLSSLGGTSTPDYFFPQGRNVTQWQIVDDLSMTKGSHELKFGVNYRRNDITDYDTQVLNSGTLNFGSMTDFFNGNVIGSNGDYYLQYFPTRATQPLAIYSVGFYAQDAWRVSNSLKLTLAIRADRNSNAVCQTNCFADLSSPFGSLNHDPSIPYNQAISANLNSAFPSIETLAWQPRIGFAYNPTFSHNTVVRGGVGLFSDLYAGVLLDNMIQNAPSLNQFLVYGNGPGTPAAPLAPGSVAALASGSNASFNSGFANGQNLSQISAANPFFVAPNFYSPSGTIQNPKYLEWNLEVEQQFGTNNVASVNYVGNHGYDLLITNPGLNISGVGPNGQAIAGIPATSPDTRFGTVTGLAPDGVSNYDGMIASFMHRFSHAFQAQINYTWSHALDDVGGLPNTPFSSGTSITTQLDPNCLRCLNYSSSDADVRHNLTGNFIVNTPFRFSNGFLNETLGGWQFGGTVYLRSGLPYSVIDSSLANALSGTFSGGTVLASYLGGSLPSCTSPSSPCLSASQFAASGSETALGTVGRNFFRGPGYFDADFNAMKNFKLTERVQMRVGANFYNVFNHPNFTAPVHDLANPYFGEITNNVPYTGTVAPVTSPYGSFQGAGVSGRLIQLEAHLQF